MHMPHRPCGSGAPDRSDLVRIAFLGDVHGAACHFGAALASARQRGFDVLVIAGDLWTYGPEPRRTFDLAVEAVARDKAVLLLGNHDPMYLAPDTVHDYVDRLPDWIRESVEWTRGELEHCDLATLGEWRDEWTYGELLLSHANPFGSRDWTYLSRPDQMEIACDTLAARGFRWGVFGHSHRAKRHLGKSGSLVVTVGSLGQPRDTSDYASQWAMIDVHDDGLLVDKQQVDLPWEAHCRAIDVLPLAAATRHRLKEFYPL